MLNTAPAKPVLTVAGRFWAALRKPMISGLLVVIPAGITFFVLKLLYDFTAGRISPFIRSYIAPLPDYISPVVACVVLFVLVYARYHHFSQADNLSPGERLSAWLKW